MLLNFKNTRCRETINKQLMMKFNDILDQYCKEVFNEGFFIYIWSTLLKKKIYVSLYISQQKYLLSERLTGFKKLRIVPVFEPACKIV